MGFPQLVIEIENKWIDRGGDAGDPSLSDAYNLLVKEWEKGNRDREVGLHIMFLAWYGLNEPAYYTGFEYGLDNKHTLADGIGDKLQSMFQEVHNYFSMSINDDPEMLFSVGLMAHLFPCTLGDEQEWESRAEEYRSKYRSYFPNGIPQNYFDGRGAYGHYFRRQAAIEDGF